MKLKLHLGGVYRTYKNEIITIFDITHYPNSIDFEGASFSGCTITYNINGRHISYIDSRVNHENYDLMEYLGDIRDLSPVIKEALK